MSTTSTVFLDRDGVINRNLAGYVTTWDAFEFLPGARHAIMRLTRSGYRLVVVTNQACVGRGIATAAAIEEIHDRMIEEVARMGGRIEVALWCPHRPDECCECRKPAPGMLLQARDTHGVDLDRAVMVGDSACDMQAACAAGVAPILLTAGRTRESVRAIMDALPSGAAPRMAYNLAHAARLILNERGAAICSRRSWYSIGRIPAHATFIATALSYRGREPRVGALALAGPRLGPASSSERARVRPSLAHGRDWWRL